MKASTALSRLMYALAVCLTALLSVWVAKASSGATETREGLSDPRCPIGDLGITVIDEVAADEPGGPNTPKEALRAWFQSDIDFAGMSTDAWATVVQEEGAVAGAQDDWVLLAAEEGGEQRALAHLEFEGDSWRVIVVSACHSFVQREKSKNS